MSTKATIYYNDKTDVHIYLEMIADVVCLECHRPGLSVDVEIMDYSEWLERGFPDPYTAPYLPGVADELKKYLHFESLADLDWGRTKNGRVLILDKCGHYCWYDDVRPNLDK